MKHDKSAKRFAPAWCKLHNSILGDQGMLCILKWGFVIDKACQMRQHQCQRQIIIHAAF